MPKTWTHAEIEALIDTEIREARIAARRERNNSPDSTELAAIIVAALDERGLLELTP